MPLGVTDACPKHHWQVVIDIGRRQWFSSGIYMINLQLLEPPNHHFSHKSMAQHWPQPLARNKHLLEIEKHHCRHDHHNPCPQPRCHTPFMHHATPCMCHAMCPPVSPPPSTFGGGGVIMQRQPTTTKSEMPRDPTAAAMVAQPGMRGSGMILVQSQGFIQIFTTGHSKCDKIRTPISGDRSPGREAPTTDSFAGWSINELAIE